MSIYQGALGLDFQELGLLEEAKLIEEDIIGWRRDLHQIPELELKLPKTSDYIRARLDELGIEHESLLGGNAVVGLIRGGLGEGRTLGLRADMDALPIREETGLAYSSKNGCMHACGHDTHMAMLLGAGKILARRRQDFRGSIKLIFQPGEEYPGGAKPMIEEGVLENPRLDGILGLHGGRMSPEFEKGQVAVSYNRLMASMDRVYIEVLGRGGHGAYPHNNVDPIVLAAEIVMSLQRLVSRETSPTDPLVLSICRIEGGFNQNITPDKVELEGTIRSFDNGLRKRIARRIEEIVKGITESNGASYNYQYDFKYPAVINNEAFTRDFVRSAGKLLGGENVVELKEPLMGGEDVSYFLEEVPGTFFLLATADSDGYPHHNSKFDVDEGQLHKGAALLAQGALDFLGRVEKNEEY